MVSAINIIFQQEKEKRYPPCFIEVKRISAGEGQVTSSSPVFHFKCQQEKKKWHPPFFTEVKLILA